MYWLNNIPIHSTVGEAKLQLFEVNQLNRLIYRPASINALDP